MTTAITSAPGEAITEPLSPGDLIRGLGGIPLSRILAISEVFSELDRHG